MTNVEDSVCTASYGASANLVSMGGKSIVGYVNQLSEYLEIRNLALETKIISPTFFCV